MSRARSPCTVCSTTIGINGLIDALRFCAPGVRLLLFRRASRLRACSLLQLLALELHRSSQQYPLDEQAATLMAESLRVKAAHEPGAEGTVGARAVADAIELRLIEDTADPIS